MGLASCLIGMEAKVENPIWWGIYVIWIATVVSQDIEAPFSTLLISSTLAGVLHGTISAMLIDKYMANNPWHAKRMRGPKEKWKRKLVVTGIFVGATFGAIVAGIGWGISQI